MRYHIIHSTICRYDSPVNVCHYHAKLIPRRLPFQNCPWHEMTIRPEPLQRFVRQDAYGNATIYFEIEGAHEELEVISSSFVELEEFVLPASEKSPTWEQIRDQCDAERWTAGSSASEYVCPSPLIRTNEELRTYARDSFPAEMPILQGALDLNHRIYNDFTFDPTATNVATKIEEAWEKKRGVCQDYAQVMIACLRSLGLPARYVSGYLETQPPPGKEKLIGADASHAWLSVWCGEDLGWIDMDPTNDIMPSTRHVTLAWGRDFSDVSPLRGVTLGAGNQSILVAVDVMPQK
jgi:transglutaminase-like putative cysteine protease